MACSLTSLFTCLWSWMLYSAAGYGAPTAPENVVYFSFLSRWLSQGVGPWQPKTQSPSCRSGDDLCGARCEGSLSAMYVAGKRAGELLIRSQSSTHFLSSTHTHEFSHACVHKKWVQVAGLTLPLWPFYRSEPPCSAQVMRFPRAWREEVLSIAQATSSPADTLVLCSDKPETWEDATRLQHFPLGQDVKCAWSPSELDFYSTLCRWCDALTFVMCHSHTFPQLPPASTCHLGFGFKCPQK